MGYEDRHGESIDDLDVLLAALPPEIVDAVHATPNREQLIEVDFVALPMRDCKVSEDRAEPDGAPAVRPTRQ